MKSKRSVFALCALLCALAVLLTSCNGLRKIPDVLNPEAATGNETGAASQGDGTAAESTEGTNAADTAETTATPANTDITESNLFAKIPSAFTFTSGVGGWATEIELKKDGSFSGEYHDSNAGEQGDGYKSTVYISKFSGKFTNVKKVDDYTYSMELDHLNTEGTTGESYISDDGIKYIISDPYGFEDAGTFMLYLPGKTVKELPQEILDWPSYGVSKKTVLSDYILYNVNAEDPFISSVEN